MYVCWSIRLCSVCYVLACIKPEYSTTHEKPIKPMSLK